MSLTIDDLKQQNLIVLDTISGSCAYGLATPQSDTDQRGVFIMPLEMYYGFNPIEQVSSERNDITYFELSKYLKLLAKNNPVSIELLFSPEECIIYKHSLMDCIKPELVISRLCRETFAGYAHSQVKRARGLNKKIFNPVSEHNPTPMDCCYVIDCDKTISVKQWLDDHQLEPDRCGLTALNHVKDGYALFYADDWHDKEINFNGLFRQDGSEDQSQPAQDVCLSSIPKGMTPRAWLVFNKDDYAKRLRDFHDYRKWEQNRNPERYQGTLAHGGGYDAKNMMHTFRLLRMAKEIAQLGKPLVCRPDREELLTIKSGQYPYEDLLAMCDQELKQIDDAYSKCNLPDQPDTNQIEQWAVEIRKAWYAEGLAD